MRRDSNKSLQLYSKVGSSLLLREEKFSPFWFFLTFSEEKLVKNVAHDSLVVGSKTSKYRRPLAAPEARGGVLLQSLDSLEGTLSWRGRGLRTNIGSEKAAKKLVDFMKPTKSDISSNLVGPNLLGPAMVGGIVT